MCIRDRDGLAQLPGMKPEQDLMKFRRVAERQDRIGDRDRRRLTDIEMEFLGEVVERLPI